MSLEEGQQPSSIVKKRSFEAGFGHPQVIIESVLPQISSIVSTAASYWQRCFGAVSQLVSSQLQQWQDEDRAKSVPPARKGKRHRIRKDETEEQRAARRASRRSNSGLLKVPSSLEPLESEINSPTTRLHKTKQTQLKPARNSIAHDQSWATQRIFGPGLNSKPLIQPRRSLRKQYSDIISSRDRFALNSATMHSRSNASPMHRRVITSSMESRRHTLSTLHTRTAKDAANVLNRITPHKARIRKSNDVGKTPLKLPFTTSTLSLLLESPSQASPQVQYRSPGAPLASPASDFNPFRTKDNNNRMIHKSDEQSLEDLIADLRREYPHQYEWQKIDKEKEARNQEIARKRGLLAPARVQIPIDTLKKVERAFHGQLPYDGVLIDKFNQEIKVKDLSTLKSTAWLNDEVINFYMNLIIERSRIEGDVKLHAFNTFFYSKLVKGGYKDVRRWAKKAKVDIAKCDLVLVPVHLGVHWCMSAINFTKQRFEYWDSLKGGAGQAFAALREYAENEAPNTDFTNWSDYVPDAGPQQRNGFDCGVFACQTAESLSRFMVPRFTQDEMPELRKRMAASILDAKIY